MTHQPPRCPLCGKTLSCDICGPIEGRPAWIRKGEKVPSEQVENAEGEVHWICKICVSRFPETFPH
jgi:transposase-like protein